MSPRNKEWGEARLMQRMILFLLPALLIFRIAGSAQDVNLFVAPDGNDFHPGNADSPVRTITKALSLANGYASRQVNIWLRGGTYYLDRTLVLDRVNFAPAGLRLSAYGKEKVRISAGARLHLIWRPYRDGIYQAEVPEGVSFEQLYVNGKLQVLARYPNFDPAARVYHGTAADAIDPKKVRKWKDPRGGYVHALHAGEWGSLDYRITGTDRDGHLQMEGGWQNNRPSPMHEQYRFVENIVEELDTISEWWLDKARHVLYYYPPRGLRLQQAVIEVSHLTNAVELHGTSGKPLTRVVLSGLQFEHTERSFMNTREPLLRSDWRIYRGGAVVLEGTESCVIEDCRFSNLGGNAIMVSGFNRKDTLRRSLIEYIGASGVCLVGDTAAVRSPSFRYEDHVPYARMDKTPGPFTGDYPQACLVIDNLIHNVGMVEKQAAGVEIDIAADITISHNSIYNTPRAGINIGDGCFGGHLLEYNDVFNTVLETGDHGAFNSWGRDRYWAADRHYMDSMVVLHPELILLDAGRQTVIRNNRFRCDHGWDIDLDDGSSNYYIHNNLCLNGGLKLREGFYRTVQNNILVNNSFHPHVWFSNSGDIFTHNIVTSPYAPILMDYWGARIDSNIFLSEGGLAKARAIGLDIHGSYGGQRMVDSAKKCLQSLNFGVRQPQLRDRAAIPPIDPLIMQEAAVNGAAVEWLGARLKNIETLGERSAAGLPDDHGAMAIVVPAHSLAATNGLQKGDVLISLGDHPVATVQDLLLFYQTIKWMRQIPCTVIRNQRVLQLDIRFNE